LSALTYQIGIFFGLITVQYTYELPAVAIGSLVCALAVPLGWSCVRSPRLAVGVGTGRDL
jgi:hypothetical protein